MMFVETVRSKHKDRLYVSHLLRETYREDGKVKHRTLANLSSLPPDVIEIIRGALKGDKFFSAKEDLRITRSLSHGGVHGILKMVQRTGLDAIIFSRNVLKRRLAIAMIVARLLVQGSKRFAAQWWKDTTLPHQLDLPEGDRGEELLYDDMDWLLARQETIQKTLVRKHLTEGGLCLFDVTSVYLEGSKCPLASFGHNRDGKKGKKQFTYGLLTNKEGCPVAIDVFPGNVSDPRILKPQIDKMKEEFGFSSVVFVGDRGMIAKTRIEDLRDAHLRWITALKSKDIQRLRNEGRIQMSLFDETNMFEVYDLTCPGERLAVCRNPQVAKERRRKRDDLLRMTEEALEKIRGQVERKRGMAREEIGLKVGKVVDRWKMAKHFELEIGDGEFSFARKEEAIARESELDGIYVIRTNVEEDALSAEQAVGGYKSLKEVEKAFKQMKSFLRIRPVNHRLESRVRSHAFLCMLAYYVQWHMIQALKSLLDEEEGHSFESLLAHLGSIQRNTVLVKDQTFEMTTEPDELHRKIFEALGISLP